MRFAFEDTELVPNGLAAEYVCTPEPLGAACAPTLLDAVGAPVPSPGATGAPAPLGVAGTPVPGNAASHGPAASVHKWEGGYDVGSALTGSARALKVAEGISVCVAGFRVQRDFVMRERRAEADLYQFGCCLEGRMRWRVGGGAESEQCAGEVSVQHVTGGECISTLPGGQACEMVSVLVSGRRLRAFVPADVLGIVGESVRMWPLSAETGAAARAMRDCRAGDWAMRMMLEAKALELVARVLGELAAAPREVRPENVAPGDFAALLAAKRYLEGHLQEKVTIAELSHRVLLNECKLKSGFKRCFGTTIQAYHRRCRMRAARDFMARDGLRVKDVAWKVGYANVSHFIEAYRKEFGATPTGR